MGTIIIHILTYTPWYVWLAYLLAHTHSDDCHHIATNGVGSLSGLCY